ncbi:MAG: serine hydrolase [Bacteroidota bacterium]
MAVRFFVLLTCFLSFLKAQAQETYFPPLQGSAWETVSPESLGWCTDALDSLDHFLEEKNTKAFLILKDGRIAYERYYDGFGPDSAWYWASAGKSLAATLVGMAQEDGLLSIEDPVSQYLGAGWTSTTPDQEAAIRIRHQLEMSTGLKTQGIDWNCLEDSCLQYYVDPGQRWFYHNAPYRLVQDVVASAANTSFNLYTLSRLSLRTGIYGSWYNYIFFSRPRNMARFGLLIQQNGIWNGDTILADTSYINAMTTPSQAMNPAYGYLWWLNGQESHRLPALDISYPGELVPNAPSEMYAAMGKNEQRLYIVPSEDLVIVRMGDAAGSPVFAVSAFDNELWGELQHVFCANSTAISPAKIPNLDIRLDPLTRQLTISGIQHLTTGQLLDLRGRLMWQASFYPDTPQQLPLHLPAGIYLLKVQDQEGRMGHKKLKLY